MKGSLANNTLTTTPEKPKDDGDISKILQCTSGRLVLKNLSDVDNLWLGNGLYADIAYQEISKVYTIEETEGTRIYNLKKEWETTKNSKVYEEYYNALTAYIEGSVNVDAI
jgi:hypothetical protein